MIDYSTQQFRTSQVAAAAGISAGTLRSYFARKQWRQIGRQADADGHPNLFSLRDALAFAVAAKLMSVAAIDPETAFAVAVEDFAFCGDDERNPGELFDIHARGETVLLYWPAVKCASLAAGDDINDLGYIVRPPFGGQKEEAAVLLVLNHLEHAVFEALGIDRKDARTRPTIDGPTETGEQVG